MLCSFQCEVHLFRINYLLLFCRKQYKSIQTGTWKLPDVNISDMIEISYDSNRWSESYHEGHIPLNDFTQLREELLEDLDN